MRFYQKKTKSILVTGILNSCSRLIIAPFPDFYKSLSKKSTPYRLLLNKVKNLIISKYTFIKATKLRARFFVTSFLRMTRETATKRRFSHISRKATSRCQSDSGLFVFTFLLLLISLADFLKLLYRFGKHFYSVGDDFGATKVYLGYEQAVYRALRSTAG